jgi:hypothetical protein
MTARQKKAPQISQDDYGAFIQGLELQNVLILETQAKRIAFPEQDAELGVEVKVLRTKCKSYADGFSVTATYELQVTQQPATDEEKEAIAPTAFGTFRVAFELVYTSQVSLSDALFEVFKTYNLPLNVWPYVRQHVHQQSVLMGLPALVLPVYRTPTG